MYPQIPMPLNGTDQMSQMMQMALLATQDPSGAAKMLAASGAMPPPIPPPAPVSVSPLADITPKQQQLNGALSGWSAPTPQLKEIPLTAPTVDPGSLAGGPTPGPANMAAGVNLGGLMQALGALQPPPQPQVFRPEFAPAMPLNRGGPGLDANIMQTLLQTAGGAQGVRPQMGLPSLGALVTGR